MHPARRPDYLSGALFPSESRLEELDNLIIDLWQKVVSSGPSAANDSFLHPPVCFNFKTPPP